MRLFCLGFILLLTACGGPTIDASSDEALERSVEEVRSSLPVDQRKKFDDALRTIAFEEVDVAGMFATAMSGGEMPDPDVTARAVRAKLDGKSASEILAMADKVEAEREAKQRQQALQEIRELEAAKSNAAAAREGLAKFQVVRSRISMRENFLGMSEPLITLTVRNGTGAPVSRAHFVGTLASPGRAIPWLKEEFNYGIPGGLEPGEEATWNLSPNQFGPWGSVDAPGDAVLTVETVQFDGADGKEMLTAKGFDEEDEARLAALRKKYGS